MISMVSVKCPDCGATLSIEEGRQNAFCTYCGAKVIIQNENERIYRHVDEARIKEVEAHKEIRLKELELEEARRIKQAEKQAHEEKIQQYKSSKLSKWSIAFFAICLLAAIVSFSNGKVLAGIVALVQTILFAGSWAMGMRIVREKRPNLYLLFAIAGFVLIIIFLKVNGQSTKSNKPTSSTNNTSVVNTAPSSNSNSSNSSDDGVYTYAIRNYEGQNLASIGKLDDHYRVDEYGRGKLRLVYCSLDGVFIDCNDEEQLKEYYVVGQSIPAGSDIVVVHQRNSRGEPYSNLIDYQSEEEIVLQVAKVGEEAPDKIDFMRIQPAPDRRTLYIRNYVGRNIASFGEASKDGRIDKYGRTEVRLSFASEDGTYIDPNNLEILRQYIVVDQDVAPNTVLNVQFQTNSKGEEYDNLIQSQNYEVITLTVRRLSDETIAEMPDLLGTSTAAAEAAAEMELTYRVMANGKVEITGFSGDGNEVSIPSKIEGRAVVRIGDSAFENCESLRSIVIWADIEEIGDSAFKNCIVLKVISIPNETTIIGDHAFEGCTALETALIWGDPDIGDYAFKGCTALTEISISNDTKRVGAHAFEGCTGVTTILIWGVETIGDYAFAGCTGITEVSIPHDVKSIGKHAFDGCSNLESVIVWDDATKIGEDAFANCPKLKEKP